MRKFDNAAEIRTAAVGYGAGRITRHHFHQMKEAGMTVSAIADLSEERRRAAREDFPGIAACASLEELLDSDVNLIAVNTPHKTHSEIALKCLAAGKHVCCEKPMALTTEECEEMIDEARSRDLMLTVYHNRHWDGGIMKALSVIRDEKRLGEVVRVEARMGKQKAPGEAWRSSRSISGGILYDWGVHLTEYALQLLDDEMTQVFGWSRSGHWNKEGPWKDDTVEDEAMAVVRFRKGGIYSLRMTNIDCDPEPFVMKVMCTEGTVSFSPHQSYRVVSSRGNETLVTEGKNPPAQWQKFYDNVAAYLTGREDLIITPEYATRPIHVLDLAGKSAREGKSLPVKHV
ncbi:MAG: Gfo/Idh/MocA family oxidoreductase [Kiritimatiellia bacterium]